MEKPQMRSLLTFLLACFFTYAQSAHAADEKKAQPAPAATSNTAKTVGAEKNKIEDKTTKIDSEDILSGLDYPELQVVPRASERIQMEAQRDWGSFVSLAPMAVSGISTFVTGMMNYNHFKASADTLTTTEKQSHNNQSMVSMVIGAGTLWGIYYLNGQEGYSAALNNIKRVKGNDKRSEVLRERLAEEALENSARMFKLAMTMSVAVNFAANIAIRESASEEVQTYSTISAALALLPLIMPNRFVDNYEKHLEYKRKIYTPLVSWSVAPRLALATKQSEMHSQFNLNWVY